jgi:hypothetical protein
MGGGEAATVVGSAKVGMVEAVAAREVSSTASRFERLARGLSTMVFLE